MKRKYTLAILVLASILAIGFSGTVCALSESDPHQVPSDAPTGGGSGSLGREGTYLRIGISDYAHYGDYALYYGFQYPKDYEHAAVAWWGEGFTFGYVPPDTPPSFVAASYESGPFYGLTFVSETILEETPDHVIYEVVLTTEDNLVELRHNFHFQKATKFVILTVTIENIGVGTLTDVRYRRVWDFDMDNTVDGADSFDVDLSKNMLYAWETHYAALAASSLTPPTEWDVNAWDDLYDHLPGPSVYTGPFPVTGDWNVRLEWVYPSLAPGESKTIIMYHIGGDSKADLDSSYDLAEGKVIPPIPEFDFSLPMITAITTAIYLFIGRKFRKKIY